MTLAKIKAKRKMEKMKSKLKGKSMKKKSKISDRELMLENKKLKLQKKIIAENIQLKEEIKELTCESENPILDKMYEDRGGMYVHAFEVNDVYDLQNIAETIYGELYGEFTEEDIISFLESASVHYLGDDDTEEEEVYNFDFEKEIKENF